MSATEPASRTAQELIETGRWRLSRETHAVEGGRRQMLEKIGEILNGGRVQALMLRVGDPIRVERLVPATDLDQLEPEEDDLSASVRNAELQDLPGPEDAPALDQLYRAFALLASWRAKPVALGVPNTGFLRSWLGREDADLREVFGVRIHYHPHLPDDAAVLAGTTDPGDPFQTVTHAVRIPVRLPEKT